jgi:hypothetical protein
MHRTTITRAAAAAATLALLAVPGIASASANSPHPPSGGCDRGVWSGYEGTQRSGTGLSIAVQGNRVVGTHGTSVFFGANTCIDFFQVAGTSDNAKYAVVANPQTGVPTGEALTAMWSPHGWELGLASTQKGSADQQFVYDGSHDFDIPGANAELATTFSGGGIRLVPESAPVTPSTTFTAIGF